MSINEGSDSAAILDSYHSFLQSLIGEEVQVYKGGPEAKKGRLLDVQTDYITLVPNNEPDKMVVYYRTEHLQSIGENSKSNSMPQLQNQRDENVYFHSEEKFFQLVEKLVGSYIQINQGGPESKTGKLLNISGNYLALVTNDDGIVYFNIHHIKSISEINTQSENFVVQGDPAPELDFFEAEDFHELFSKMSHKWVAINRGGPEALEGVLVQSTGNHYTLINNDEVLRINPYHIKSISSGPKGAMKQYYSQQQKNTQDSNQDFTSKRRSDHKSSSSSSSSSYNTSRNYSSSSSSDEESSTDRQESMSSRTRSSSSNQKSSSSSQKEIRAKRRSSHEKIVKTLDYIWKPRS